MKLLVLSGEQVVPKTSLVQLIPRLYDITAGDLLIDGHDIKSYGIEHLRDEIAMVLQKNTLFSGTIKENILWGKADASDHELNEVLDIACASEFIDALPKGINTDLGKVELMFLVGKNKGYVLHVHY
mgnify:CR=1 FL=1